MELKGIKVGFVLTGSFCTFKKVIPKIKEVSFGDRLLNKLLSNYPQLININNYNNNIKKKNNNYGYHSNDKGENNEQQQED